ncbi:TPA: hypothetical protein ACN6Y1_000687 [Escherichia albertii]|uniref:Uncharacterized protein n=2 Tax=Escherichia TaxID=561 RepID=A0A789M9G3_ECOLX|nr:hypothetical protein [Escherichia albertii]AHE62022.1 hypothetical protein EAKF1_ch4208c [Escherichia albertii KF1]EDS90710.1 hypothetical protein ESCAB7627_3404 [Escherichia albertii TW07627]EFZ2304813.1 hypothetical protein [Shigella boydii]EEU9596587.1 hypothetical protein [Escherichia albertii]EEX2833623.1 hypothetical protein [Escherichia albertii]
MTTNNASANVPHTILKSVLMNSPNAVAPPDATAEPEQDKNLDMLFSCKW